MRLSGELPVRETCSSSYYLIVPELACPATSLPALSVGDGHNMDVNWLPGSSDGHWRIATPLSQTPVVRLYDWSSFPHPPSALAILGSSSLSLAVGCVSWVLQWRLAASTAPSAFEHVCIGIN